ncbi:hypothetical protein K456DRAFT_1848428 [Colletotrichum gloeosporioides 23]|nr:hypothetical protein K456DRAFT_1848428 [Colletotrichum gloeosporioides 23]
MATAPTTFPQFSSLPTELRRSIWEEAVAGPSMHVVDVCFPSRRGNSRSRRAFQGLTLAANHHPPREASSWSRHEYIAFLDSVPSNQDEDSRPTMTWPRRSTRDPSMYLHRRFQRQACHEAASVSSLKAANINTVYFPGQARKFEYDNDQDVLHLRFSSQYHAEYVEQTSSSHGSPHFSSIAEALEAHWSTEMALTVWQARRIAIDVRETSMPLSLVEIEYLASCIQKGLECIYLIDDAEERGSKSGPEHFNASSLQQRGRLYRLLHSRQLKQNVGREPDVFQGVGKTYREVFDFEKIGWTEAHPAFGFACRLSASIDAQQYDGGEEVFKGVRILLAEDDYV